MLLIEELLHTLLLVVNKGSTADLIHEEQDRLVSIPKVLLGQDPHPELQHCSSSNTTGPRAFYNVTLKDNLQTS